MADNTRPLLDIALLRFRTGLNRQQPRTIPYNYQSAYRD